MEKCPFCGSIIYEESEDCFNWDCTDYQFDEDLIILNQWRINERENNTSGNF